MPEKFHAFCGGYESERACMVHVVPPSYTVTTLKLIAIPHPFGQHYISRPKGEAGGICLSTGDSDFAGGSLTSNLVSGR